MKGRDLVVYIMQNRLEDSPVFNNGKFIGFLKPEEAALKIGSGPATVQALMSTGQIDGIKIPKETILIADDEKLRRRSVTP